MKNAIVVLFVFLFITAAAQKVQTIAPNKPIIEGTAFQIQYVITNPAEVIKVSSPDFDSLKLISGPNHYKGMSVIDGKQQPIDNIAYTVLAEKAGKYSIKGPDITYKNLTLQRGQDFMISVIPAPKASYNTRSSYTDVNLYAPSKKVDYDRLIHDNLFVKTESSKRTCYAGEPIVVTFTLYSRLESSTEATKSPAFYGFSVADMVDINKSHPGVKTIDGKVFNTSILRKVQLYPVEKGKFTIDRMYLHNEIEFDDSLHKGNKKIKINQDLESDPIAITVNPLPGKPPSGFTEAVGDFTIKSRLKSDTIQQHQEAVILVDISGKGNFLQFGQPAFDSIPGIDIIDVTTSDNINNSVAPQEGTRTYRISFTADTTGILHIPAVYFSYFDVKQNRYKTIHTDSLVTRILPLANQKVQVNKKKRFGNRLIWVFAIVIIIILGFAIQFFRLQKKPNQIPHVKGNDYSSALEEEQLSSITGKEAMLYIQKILRGALNDEKAAYSEKQRNKIRILIEKCELMIYTNVELTTPEKLRKEAYDTLKMME